MKSDPLIEHLLTEDPVSSRGTTRPAARDRPGTEAGGLRRLLPGVYVDAGRADELAIKAAPGSLGPVRRHLWSSGRPR